MIWTGQRFKQESLKALTVKDVKNQSDRWGKLFATYAEGTSIRGKNEVNDVYIWYIKIKIHA